MKNGRGIIFGLIIGALVACGCSQYSLPRVQGPAYGDEQFTVLLATPMFQHRKPVRLIGWCRVEFEGNALYITRDAREQRDGSKGVWLNLGWPVSQELLRLDGRRVVVTGQFNAEDRGHYAAFVGAIEKVESIEIAEPPTSSSSVRTADDVDDSMQTQRAAHGVRS